MAYSVFKKHGKAGTVIDFLADTAADFPFIIDACDPGSTINVLKDPSGEGPNTYMKAPSGKWIHIDGKQDVLPKNDVKVIDVPDQIDGCNIPVADMQTNISVHPQGLVTGTSHAVKGNALFSKDGDGHFVSIGLEKPSAATHIQITGGTTDRPRQAVPTDNTYMWKLDEMRKQGKESATVTFYKDESNGEAVGSFTFNFSKVKFD